MILVFSYIAVVVCVAGLAYRGIKIASMPVHLRWELAPVPHEKGKAHYGGSYLEEFEWWTKPREKSLLNEGFYMFQEIGFLKGVWENNRPLWWFSFPFHFGLYLLVGMTLFLFLEMARIPEAGRIASWLASFGYILGTIGAVGLFFKRAFDPKLSPFTTAASYINLLVVGAVFATGAYAFFSARGDFAAEMIAFIKAFFAGDVGVRLSGPTRIHVAAGMLFLLYLPFSYMTHFMAKYFTYHEIRWNDEPMGDNPAMQEKVKKLLGQTVSWSAPHIGADGRKNWVDVATADMRKEKEGSKDA